MLSAEIATEPIRRLAANVQIFLLLDIIIAMEDTSAVCQETKKNPDLLYSALKGEDYALVNDVVPSLTVDEFKQLAAFLCGSAEIEHLSCQSSCPPRSLHLRTRAAAARPAVCLYGRNTEEVGTHNL